MAGDKQEAPWPVGSMHFSVRIGDLGEIAFQKVSGLKMTYQIVEYRAGNSIDYNNVKMPLAQKFSDVYLTKGMFKDDKHLMTYMQSVKLNTIKRETVTIQLLDEEHSPIFTWTLKNAFPKEIAFGELDAMNATFAIEQIVLSHEGLSLE